MRKRRTALLGKPLIATSGNPPNIPRARVAAPAIHLPPSPFWKRTEDRHGRRPTMLYWLRIRTRPASGPHPGRPASLMLCLMEAIDANLESV